MYSHRYQAQRVCSNLPEDIKAGARNWEFLDFRVLTALPSWSDGLRAVKTIGQTLTPITLQTQSLSNNPGNGDHHLIWNGVESKAQGHKGVQSPTGFTGASYSWTEPAASYTNMESPHLCQVCEINEQNNIVHDQVFLKRENADNWNQVLREKKKQILAGEWQLMGKRKSWEIISLKCKRHESGRQGLSILAEGPENQQRSYDLHF